MSSGDPPQRNCPLAPPRAVPAHSVDCRHSLLHILRKKVVVERDGGLRPRAGGRDQLGRRVDDIAGSPHSGHAGEPGRIGCRPTVLARVAPQIGEQVVMWHEARANEHR